MTTSTQKKHPSQLTFDQFDDFVALICTELGEDWKISTVKYEYWRKFITITDSADKILSIRLLLEDSGNELEIFACEPNNPERFSTIRKNSFVASCWKSGEEHAIDIAVDRGPHAIANAIKSKLLPGMETYLANLDVREAENIQSIQRYQTTIKVIESVNARCLTKKPHYSDIESQFLIETSHISGLIGAHCYRGVSFQLFDVPEDLLTELVTTINNYKPHQ